MKAKLVVVGGETKTPEVELKLPAILGRGREATLTLPHPLVSRQHCEIFEANGQLMVRDLGSLNGTFVANERITEAVLEHGQLLTVGTVTFRAMHLDDNGQVPAGQAAIPTASPVGASDKTVPAPSQGEQTVDFESNPPMAMPVEEAPAAPAAPTAPAAPAEPAAPAPSEAPAPAETPADQADDEDDMSSFFDSLK